MLAGMKTSLRFAAVVRIILHRMTQIFPSYKKGSIQSTFQLF